MPRLALSALCLLLPASLPAAADKTAPSPGLDPLVRLLAASEDAELQRDILRGMHEALQGRGKLTAPASWSAVARKLAGSPSPEVREKALLLSVMFGDTQALIPLRQTVADGKADAAARRTALQTLVEARAPDLLPLLRPLLADPALRRQVLQALAVIRDPETPALILKHYPALTDAEKADAIATLSSRADFALALLEAIERKEVPGRDLSPFTVRQLLSLRDKKLTEKIEKVWGTVRPTSQDKKTLLARYLNVVPPDALKKADRSHGRALFAKHCASCHVLFNEGQRIGPELTGSQRANPEYILTKVLDPNAVVARDYLLTILTTNDGRTISGLVKEENDKTLTLQTTTQAVLLAKVNIAERNRSNQSLMPERLLEQLKNEEVRDLIAYLAGPEQVPLPGATKEKPEGKPAPRP